LILSEGNGTTCHGDSIATYLEALSICCAKVADRPEPRTLKAISGVLKLASQRIMELKQAEAQGGEA
jgi:hypothetical protein